MFNSKKKLKIKLDNENSSKDEYYLTTRYLQYDNIPFNKHIDNIIKMFIVNGEIEQSSESSIDFNYKNYKLSITSLSMSLDIRIYKNDKIVYISENEWRPSYHILCNLLIIIDQSRKKTIMTIEEELTEYESFEI